MLIDRTIDIPLGRQCDLLGLSRSSLYYRPVRDAAIAADEQRVLNAIDELYTQRPYLGRRGMADALAEEKELCVNPKRVRRLMKVLGLQAVYPKPRRNTSTPDREHPKYPYLLRQLEIDHADQVWCADITYIRLYRGFAYLVAIMDWFSRYVLSWELSNTLDASFCVSALQAALATGRRPEIFNTDQGSQFTSEVFTGVLSDSGIAISMDGVGRAFDNIMVERLWRTVKYEDVYLRDYQTPAEARMGLGRYFAYYNHLRRHSGLGRVTPGRVYGVEPSALEERLLAKPEKLNMIELSGQGRILGPDGKMIETGDGRSIAEAAVASATLRFASAPAAGMLPTG